MKNQKANQSKLTKKEIFFMPIGALALGAILGAIIFPTGADKLGASITMFVFMVPIILISLTTPDTKYTFFIRFYYIAVGLIGSAPLISYIIH